MRYVLGKLKNMKYKSVFKFKFLSVTPIDIKKKSIRVENEHIHWSRVTSIKLL